ncbi:MAG: site-2 protease family protein [Deltaproteobacteria bacterium]|nr:site-2 protease family protein [Deltaproteobacteria bacterium]
MFGKKINLFRLLGFEVRIDLSWIIIAVLIAWSLSTGLFPFYYKNLSIETYWAMGIIAAVGLFLSIIVHEFSHSLVARKYGIPMKGITLFIFGGVAEMEDEPSSPKVELLMAGVGPLSSIAIAAIFYGIYSLGKTIGWAEPVNGVVEYLGLINAILAGFNLLPAFPLDGGRVLRAALWHWKRNMRWATRISAQIGSGFGILLIVLGFFNILRADFIAGMWWVLIGMFLQSAAKMSYKQLITRRALEGEKVRRFMNSNPVTVEPTTTVDELVEDYVYKYHFKMFPVVNGERIVGCVTTKQVKEVPREKWSHTTVSELALKCTPDTTVKPDDDAMKALSLMRRTGGSRLVVVEDDQLAGVVALKDMMQFLSLKVDLDE